MLIQAFVLIVTVLGGLFTLALLLRFLLQALRVPARNQLAPFLAALTDFVVRPARRVIPGLWGLDLATLLLAWLIQVAQIWLVLALRGYEPGPQVGLTVIALAALGAVQIAKLAIYIIMVALFMLGILSWVVPDSPIAPLLMDMTRPFLRPVRRFIPPIANVDLSPLVAFLVGLIIFIPLLEAAERLLRGMLGVP